MQNRHQKNNPSTNLKGGIFGKIFQIILKVSRMKSEALELCHQEFKNNSVRFLLAIAIEPGYFQSFEEIVQAVSLESAIPYKDLASYQKDFLRSWDEVYEKACAEAYRRENRESPNLNWFEQMQQCHQKNELLTTGNFSGDVRERKL